MKDLAITFLTTDLEVKARAKQALSSTFLALPESIIHHITTVDEGLLTPTEDGFFVFCFQFVLSELVMISSY